MWADRPARRGFGRRRFCGFTAVELIISVLLIGAVSSWAVPAFLQRLQQVKIDRATLDIGILQSQINRFFDDGNERYPDSLDELEGSVPPDPWGNPYQYLSSADANWKSDHRKDRFLRPLNNDYDLSSMGPDGESRDDLRANESRDDIVRANTGGYIGPASEF